MADRARPITDLRLLLVTHRPALRAVFATVAHTVDAIALAPDTVATMAERADVVVIDCAGDPVAAARIAETLTERRPEVPLAGLVCCSQSLTPWNLRRLISSGVTSLLDLHGDAEETARALRSVADGGSVLSLHRRDHRAFFRDTLIGGDARGEVDLHLLELVAQGLPDHVIGQRLFLSPHTVKKHIEQLRDQVGARNRIELAAWAGRHGLYDGERQRATA